MNPINNIVNDIVIPELKRLRVENGFSLDLNVYSDFITNLITSYNTNQNALKFPFLAIEPDVEYVVSTNDKATQFAREFTLVAAIKDKEQITDRLNNLLYDLRVILSSGFKASDGIKSVTLGKVKFNFSDQNAYASIETTLTIKWVENVETSKN